MGDAPRAYGAAPWKRAGNRRRRAASARDGELPHPAEHGTHARDRIAAPHGSTAHSCTLGPSAHSLQRHGYTTLDHLRPDVRHSRHRHVGLCRANCRRSHAPYRRVVFLFGIIALVSRTANSFQGPFIAKRVELDISRHLGEGLLADFRLFLLSATVASVVGALLIPTFQRYFSRAVHHFQANRSVSRLLLRAFSRDGVGYIRGGARLPSRATSPSWQQARAFPGK